MAKAPRSGDSAGLPAHTVSPHPDDGCADVRCACGSLIARLVPGGVELKCRRCKRTNVIELSS